MKTIRREILKSAAFFVFYAQGAQSLGFYNREMKFTVETGMFKVWSGANSAEGLEAEFELIR